MALLGVNIDHVATLRQARFGIEPEPVFAVLLAQVSGADSIVAHLREDCRHINERDVRLIKEVVKSKFNLEMSIAPEIVGIACQVCPNQVTLVPEKRQEVTTEGGLDVAGNFKKIRVAMDKLEKRGIGVSLFIDPDMRQIDAAKKISVGMVELHTGRYAIAKIKGVAEEKKYFQELKSAASYAKKAGLQVFAGHGLDYYNVSKVAAIDEIEELNIGYSIICRAVLVGLERAIREMKALMDTTRGSV